ncbi:MAG TPA: Hsp33 family molecular chaperone HslO [Deltaproteobacteria bacterium]|nr:Hsp33 family molecular chaperone HslO [Deltaproteobacteria bacterium]HNQ86162.1 Hsp33 family molecular chaperone HslO [Deltaproteobacteria bacterium]HNS89957.1 Hsp33 family molecular chaperone HslO [Deltaproteobacteria bacterium]HOA45264.1 Hsp33 family molecular chaperone HslO [Deltaproteobacteria bacterium]HOC76297.1 Hsp33 family molecular chaperone HslO [Deltaproteobacteria bacterium]
MNDYLVRVITEEKNIVGLACVTTNLVDDARRRHGTCPTATAALGRALTGGELMGALLDPDQRVALKFTGNGPLRKIIVEAEGDGTVRGYVEVPRVDLPPRNGKLDVGGAIGREGYLTVTKDLRLKEPYNGIVKLYTGEIASDIAFYLTESEQIPSAVGLGVYVEADGNVSASGGFLVQSLPPADEALIDTLAERIQGLPPVTRQLIDGMTPEGILAGIFEGIPYRTIETRRLSFRCSCSVSRIEQALITLGRSQLEEVVRDQEVFDISCHFCNRNYVFRKEHLLRLIREMQ